MVEEGDDIIDETLYYFKSNMLFKTFEIKGIADRVMLYLTLYTHQCLMRLQGVNKDQAPNKLFALAMESFVCPGEAGFPLTSFYPQATAAELSSWREYMKQCRVELGQRLVEKVFLYPEPSGTGNKHWLQFSKERLMDKALEK